MLNTLWRGGKVHAIAKQIVLYMVEDSVLKLKRCLYARHFALCFLVNIYLKIETTFEFTTLPCLFLRIRSKIL